MGDRPVEEPPAEVPRPDGDTLTVDLSARSVAVALAALTALAAVVTAATRAPVASTLLVISLFLGLALDPVTVAVERRLHLSRLGRRRGAGHRSGGRADLHGPRRT